MSDELSLFVLLERPSSHLIFMFNFMFNYVKKLLCFIAICKWISNTCAPQCYYERYNIIAKIYAICHRNIASYPWVRHTAADVINLLCCTCESNCLVYVQSVLCLHRQVEDWLDIWTIQCLRQFAFIDQETCLILTQHCIQCNNFTCHTNTILYGKKFVLIVPSAP